MEARFLLQAIIVADGEVRPGAALSRALDAARAAALIVAADGGAIKAEQLGLRPHVVVGDGDSLSVERATQLREAGVEVIVHSVAKDESDTELAVREAVARGATSIVILGAFGGERVEHSVANLLLLALAELQGIDAALVDGASTVRMMGVVGASSMEVRGSPADFVSLLPLSERVDGVTTDGLRFPLADETLVQGPARGLSNELIGIRCEVSTRSGRLAVIHTARADLDQEAKRT
jgi:thiamine pyrophosphokinase